MKRSRLHHNECLSIQWFEGVRTCKETDSLFSVLEAIVKAEVRAINDNKLFLNDNFLSSIVVLRCID